MLEEGENEGVTKLFMAATKGREIVVVELIITLLPWRVQVIPEGSEQVIALHPNSAGNDMARYEKGKPLVDAI